MNLGEEGREKIIRSFQGISTLACSGYPFLLFSRQGHPLHGIPSQDRQVSKLFSDLPADAFEASKRMFSHGRKPPSHFLGPLLLVSSELLHRQHQCLAHPKKSPESPGKEHSQRLGFLDELEHTNAGFPEKSHVCQKGDVLFHRLGVDQYDFGPDCPSLYYLVPDNRIQRLRSFQSQSLSELAQGRGFDV